jgi:hypothetical protein
MCNLFRLRPRENISRIFDAKPLELPFEARPDVYPKYESLVVCKEAGERLLDCMAWGIGRTMPGKSGKPIKKAVTNVRNLDSPFWRSTIANPAQRCLVPFTSFAEPRPGKDPETGGPANWWHDSGRGSVRLRRHLADERRRQALRLPHLRAQSLDGAAPSEGHARHPPARGLRQVVGRGGRGRLLARAAVSKPAYDRRLERQAAQFAVEAGQLFKASSAIAM